MILLKISQNRTSLKNVKQKTINEYKSQKLWYETSTSRARKLRDSSHIDFGNPGVIASDWECIAIYDPKFHNAFKHSTVKIVSSTSPNFQ